LFVTNEKIVPCSSRYTYEFIIKLVHWTDSPGINDPIYPFEFKKRVLSVNYSHPKMISLHSKSYTQGTCRLMSMYYLYFLLHKNAFGLRIVCEKIWKTNISCNNWKRKVISFYTIYPANPTILWRIAMSYNDDFIYPIPEYHTELFDLHFYSSETGKKEITDKCYR